MIQGIILFTLIIGDVLVRYRVRIDRAGAATAPPATPAAAAAPSPAPAARPDGAA
jgi:hypothetical protein